MEQTRMILTMFKWVSYMTLILTFLVIVLFMFWGLYPYKTIEIKTVNLVNSAVFQGQQINYELDYCKYTDKEVLVSKRYVDGLIYSMPDVTAKNPVGCRTITVAVDVPHSLPAGIYNLEIVYEYQLNPIRTMQTSLSLGPITVLERDRK